MKKTPFAVIALLLILVSLAAGEDTKSFQNYKKLSLPGRIKLQASADLESQKTYKRWDGIIAIGGKWWDPLRQGKPFISAKGFGALSDLSHIQLNLWGYYLFQRADANKKAGMSEELAQRTAASVAFAASHSDIKKLDTERYKDDEWYLVKLAPTPEALALNEKAAAIGLDWLNRFGNGQLITLEDLKTIDATMKEIRDEMRKLPQLTPEQIETGLAALPEYFEHG